MTAAQKKAKDNFKKAIAYRKKSGCSLKEAFAHVYGKKVGAVKKKVVKKAAPKKKAAKKAAKKKAAPKKKAAVRNYGSHKDTKSHNVNIRVVSGIKKYNWEQLDNLRLTRVNNDINGNPRYVIHFLELLNNEERNFLPFNKKYEYALKKAKIIGGRKFSNKQYGGGIVFQSYNTDNLKEQIIDVMETTPKIKY